MNLWSFDDYFFVRIRFDKGAQDVIVAHKAQMRYLFPALPAPGVGLFQGSGVKHRIRLPHTRIGSGTKCVRFSVPAGKLSQMQNLSSGQIL
ncbi:MAG: hypothetical protein U5R06_02450 [candidate division KSB1 bacterium]|nr:hypothetical protein [candidate division KSB1 bacterium]